jgi:hypothetical protein
MKTIEKQLKNMKNVNLYAVMLFLSMIALSISSCKKSNGEREPVSTDQTKPGIVTAVKVDNYNGGAFITYDLPSSENILYVLAKYQIREGVFRETKSSYYTDSITVDGFAKDQEYNVTLYTVSRANVVSDPVTVTVHPKKPVYAIARENLVVTPDFGGVNIKTNNSSKKEIGILVMLYNPSTKEMDIVDQHYTKDEIINYSVRGYNTDPRNFGIYITDKYGNISDTLQTAITPLFEVLLDKSLFTENRLPSDTKLYTEANWPVNAIWNGRTDNSANGWHTLPGEVAPYTLTFNVGRTYQLSRFIFWERSDEYAYGHGNPKVFSLWGSNAPNPADARLPVGAAEGTVIGDWVNLGNYNYPPPPSGLPPLANNAADKAFVKAGVNFNVRIDAPPVHFIRVSVDQTWGGGTFAHFMEISLYGKPN